MYYLQLIYIIFIFKEEESIHKKQGKSMWKQLEEVENKETIKLYLSAFYK